jgi:outer membrane receptor protein involved in Fe transport
LTGIRVEFTYMANEHNQADPQVPLAHARFYYFDYLPSLHLKYTLMEKQNLRFSVYQAINRPNYTEVIPYSDIRPGGMTGNPNLKHSFGTSYDLRYEIYPQREEVFTAGVFYKIITNAIEELIKPGSESRSVQNVASCTNWGLELVGIKYFGELGIDVNYTFTHSEVIVPKHFNLVDAENNVTTVVKKETRPLVGQSPHVFNAGLTYRNNRYGLKLSLVYTMQGKHVINVSDSYGKDEYQQNYHNVGATVEKLINKKLAVLVKTSNLLNYPIKCYTKDGDFVEKLNNYQSYFIGLKLTI